jgi:hypothetical protein
MSDTPVLALIGVEERGMNAKVGGAGPIG